MRLIIRCALCMEKRTASIQFLILRFVILCALWSRKYGNYNQTSYQTTLFRHHCRFSEVFGKSEPDLQPRGGIRGQSSQTLFCQENFSLKSIIKTEVETPEKRFVPLPQTFRPRLRVWPKRTLKGETEANCRVRRTANLSKYVDCM